MARHETNSGIHHFLNDLMSEMDALGREGGRGGLHSPPPVPFEVVDDLENPTRRSAWTPSCRTVSGAPLSPRASSRSFEGVAGRLSAMHNMMTAGSVFGASPGYGVVGVVRESGMGAREYIVAGSVVHYVSAAPPVLQSFDLDRSSGSSSGDTPQANHDEEEVVQLGMRPRQQLPPSPCPDAFDYGRGGGGTPVTEHLGCSCPTRALILVSPEPSSWVALVGLRLWCDARLRGAMCPALVGHHFPRPPSTTV